MKKICIALVIVLVLTVSVRPGRAIVGYAVAAIVGASAIVVGSSLMIPGLIKGADNKEGWASLGVTIANVASLSASIALQASGLPTIASAIRNFVSGHGLSAIVNNVVGYMHDVLSPPAGFTCDSSNGCSVYSTINEANLAIMALGFNSNIVAGATHLTCFHPAWNGHPNVTACGYATGYAPSPVSTFAPYTASVLGTDLSTGVAAGDVGAINLVKAALTELDENMQGNSSSLGTTLTNSGKTILNNAVTQAQADTIAGVTPRTPEEIAADAGTAAITAAQYQAAMIAALKAQGLSDAQIMAAVSAALALNPGLTAAQVQAAMTAALTAAGTGLTSEQMQAAIEAAMLAKGLTATGIQSATKAALDDETGVSEPVEPTTIIPTKLSLTGVMTAFMASINGMPLMVTLRGLTINVSGSSSLCLNMPSNLGGNQCWDAGGMSDGLNMIGTVFLSLTTLFSFVSIFKG